jgi:plastocyanin
MPRVLPVGRLSAVGAFVALALAGCAAGASPSPSSQAASPSASAAAASPSASASAEASASPSGSAEASASASASAGASGGASAGPSGVAGADLTVTGVDYAFAGIPDGVDAGTVLGFRNEGDEVHEMIVVRINDDVAQSLPELLALPQEEAMQLVQDVGMAVANPGEDAEETVTLTEEGNYGMICFIPLGTTSLPEGSGGPPASGEPLPSGIGSGPPHFTLGMLKQFSVGG